MCDTNGHMTIGIMVTPMNSHILCDSIRHTRCDHSGTKCKTVFVHNFPTAHPFWEVKVPMESSQRALSNGV